MSEDNYPIANLNADEVNEIKRFEQQLSEKSGHPIALIAYDIDNSDSD
ncbi:hypothetical protein [Cohnella yongneupensis]|uniref:GTPase HflX n=1 Tax=Cohnella yongneupensis TaxID=425006 RepID=A0ABW0R0Z7_9BACL